eukprot:jgi/Orpsp1_1/1175665/evm.model.c7180000054754.1
MDIENENLRLESPLFKEKETILDEYCLKICLKGDLDNDKRKIILINAKNIHNNELFLYEKILKYEDSQTLGDLFKLCKTIEHVHELLSNFIEKNRIKIEKIHHGKFIILSMTSDLELNYSKNIKLLRRDFNNEEIVKIIENYQLNVKELIEENKILKKNINDINQIKKDIEKQLEKNKQKINLYEKVNRNFGNENLVKYLVEHGADINKENKDGKTPLFDAFKYLVELGADINKKNKDGYTPLFDACKNGNENLVKYLVEHGADINKENSRGYVPIFSACFSGNENLVKYLVELGADINKECRYGYIPLFDACSGGNENLVKYLVELGADINKESNWNETPLRSACWNGNEKLVKYLVEHGADIHKVAWNKETPLFNACKNGNEKLVKYLVELGADINKENNGNTPLFDACKNGNENLVKYLVERGVD